MRSLRWSWPALILFLAAPAAAEWSGDIGLEARAFLQPPLDARQHEAGLSIYAAP